LAELRTIVLRAFEEALGARDGGLLFDFPYQMASKPDKTTRTPFHRDWPLAFEDLRLAVCTLNCQP
jgi:hypothetical protein